MAFDPKSKDGKKVLELMSDVFKQLNAAWPEINKEAQKVHKSYRRYRAFKDSLYSDPADQKKLTQLFDKSIEKNKDLVSKYNATRKLILTGKSETIV